MGYGKPFETESAIYVLSLEDHNTPDYSFLEKYSPDAVIVESGMGFDPSFPRSVDQEHGIKKITQRTPAPIYGVDPSVRNQSAFYERYKQFQLSVLMGGFGLFFLVKGGPQKWGGDPSLLPLGGSLLLASEVLFPKLHYFARPNLKKAGPVDTENIRVRISDAMQKWIKPVTIDGRNALFAEKIEGRIAGQLKKKLKRKPLIVIQIGHHHTGIRSYLLNADRRRKTLRKLGDRIKKYLVNSHLDHSYRIQWDPSRRDYAIMKVNTPVTRFFRKRIPAAISNEIHLPLVV